MPNVFWIVCDQRHRSVVVGGVDLVRPGRARCCSGSPDISTQVSRGIESSWAVFETGSTWRILMVSLRWPPTSRLGAERLGRLARVAGPRVRPDDEDVEGRDRVVGRGRADGAGDLRHLPEVVLEIGVAAADCDEDEDDHHAERGEHLLAPAPAWAPVTTSTSLAASTASSTAASAAASAAARRRTPLDLVAERPQATFVGHAANGSGGGRRAGPSPRLASPRYGSAPGRRPCGPDPPEERPLAIGPTVPTAGQNPRTPQAGAAGPLSEFLAAPLRATVPSDQTVP